MDPFHLVQPPICSTLSSSRLYPCNPPPPPPFLLSYSQPRHFSPHFTMLLSPPLTSPLSLICSSFCSLSVHFLFDCAPWCSSLTLSNTKWLTYNHYFMLNFPAISPLGRNPARDPTSSLRPLFPLDVRAITEPLPRGRGCAFLPPQIHQGTILWQRRMISKPN